MVRNIVQCTNDTKTHSNSHLNYFYVENLYVLRIQYMKQHKYYSIAKAHIIYISFKLYEKYFYYEMVVNALAKVSRFNVKSTYASTDSSKSIKSIIHETMMSNFGHYVLFNEIVFTEPEFVGSYSIPDTHSLDDDKVYFFFKETAVESNQLDKRVYSRVARVCKVSAEPHPIMSQI